MSDTSMTAAAARAPAGERPLPPLRHALVVARATLTLLAFYAYAAAALLGIGAAMLVGVAAAVAVARFGMAARVLAPVRRLGSIGGAMLRSLGLERGTQYEMPLSRAEAPGLHEMVEATALRVGARVPDRVVLTLGVNAFVRFGGLVRERGRTTLGVGFDLLAGMPRSHVAAVVAHEMAHARLIQRGFHGWIFRGNVRIHQLAGTLREMGGQEHRAGGSDTARLLAKVPTGLGRACSRLVAAYSRQHEFAADRLSAEVCGGRVAAAALLETHVLAEGAAGVDWRDRMARVERGGSYAEWLRGRLLPADAEHRARRERRALLERNDDESTHPALADRIAALPATGAAPSAGEAPGTALLADADATAVGLVRHVDALAEAEGRRESERLRRQLYKRVRGAGTTPERWAGIALVAGVAAVFFAGLGALVVDGAPARLDALAYLGLPGLAVAAAAYALKRRLRWRERVPAPMPGLPAVLEAMKVPPAERMPGDWSVEIEARLKAGLPARAARRRGRRAAHWGAESYRALEACDFRTAWVAARLCLRERGTCPEGQVAFGLATAYLTGKGIATLDAAVGTAGPGPSLSWTTGWAFHMLGRHHLAEVYLLDAVARNPGRATPAALLARAHGHQGKPREAERAARLAIAAEPDEPLHREYLVNLLIGGGRARSAREELAALTALRPGDEGDRLRALRLHVLMGEDEQAMALADEIGGDQPDAAKAFEVAQVLSDGETEAVYAAAERWYRQPCEEGFRGAAMLGLASIAHRRGDHVLARERLLAGMDLTAAHHPDAPHAAALFTSFCRGLQALGEPEACGAWWTTLSLPGAPEGCQRLKVLVCHADAASAAGLAAEVRAALDPTAEHAEAPECTPATGDDVPGGPAVPGIYRYQFLAA